MSLSTLRDRKIAPNWRSLEDTLLNGELNGVHDSDIALDWTHSSFSSVNNQWRNSGGIGAAADMVHAYMANHLPLTDNVRSAASFILNRLQKENAPLLYHFSSRILREESINTTEKNEDVSDCFTKKDIIQRFRTQVSTARKRLYENPRSAVRHLDLARAYMSLGEHDAAVRAIVDGVSLAPNNRYVTRCAVKCFLHLGDKERAFKILKQNNNYKDDPWLLAASLSVDLLRSSKVVTDIKKVRRIIEDPLITRKSITELASTLATLEARQNSTKPKEVRRLIRKSLLDPIDNSIAQAQWLRHKDSCFDVLIPNISSQFGYEYNTFKYESEGKYQEALLEAYKWMQDKPFSRRAVLECSNILGVYLKDYEKALEILEIGLMANPTAEDLLNNAAYLYARSNRLDEAIKKINIASKCHIDSEVCNICLTATCGLIFLRSHNIELGKQYYEEAIRNAEKRGYKEYGENARLNYYNELYIAGQMSKEKLEQCINHISLTHKNNKIFRKEIADSVGIKLDNIEIE